MSHEPNSTPNPARHRPGWNRPSPEKLPEPTAWPVGLALAITLVFWGMVSSLIISGVGIALFVISITGWIRDIQHERKQP